MKMPLLVGLAIVAILSLGLPLAQSDEDHDDNEYSASTSIWARSTDVAPVQNPGYIEECASCHMAYPPGLLPARSWQRLMTGLDDHFGDNAALDPATAAALTRYLVENSADASDYRRSRRIARTLAANATPLRITAIPYIRHEHGEIPAPVIKRNSEVRSLSNCDACHARAEQGSFSEREIRIPGFGRWDD